MGKELGGAYNFPIECICPLLPRLKNSHGEVFDLYFKSSWPISGGLREGFWSEPIFLESKIMQ